MRYRGVEVVKKQQRMKGPLERRKEVLYKKCTWHFHHQGNALNDTDSKEIYSKLKNLNSSFINRCSLPCLKMMPAGVMTPHPLILSKSNITSSLRHRRHQSCHLQILRIRQNFHLLTKNSQNFPGANF